MCVKQNFVKLWEISVAVLCSSKNSFLVRSYGLRRRKQLLWRQGRLNPRSSLLVAESLAGCAKPRDLHGPRRLVGSLFQRELLRRAIGTNYTRLWPFLLLPAWNMVYRFYSGRELHSQLLKSDQLNFVILLSDGSKRLALPNV